MTFDYWCVFIAFLLPYILTTIAKVGSAHFNNNTPRDYMDKLQGWRKRAYWAHLNSFEAFSFFAAGVIIAHQLHASAMMLNILAAIFIAARVLYAIFYIMDKSTLRSLTWLLGFLVTMGLFIAASRVGISAEIT